VCSSDLITIATRGSALALAQANAVLAQCRTAFPDQDFKLKIIKTTGDKLLTASLADAGLPKGLFTKELEAALLNGEADLAVHSLKDLPTDLPPGLRLGAVCQRADARDILIYRNIECLASGGDAAVPALDRKRGFKPPISIDTLPPGATVGTSSTRRSAQVLERRPDLRIVALRGNVGTRLRKMAEQSKLDAIILAIAGLERLQIQLTPSGSLEGEGVPRSLAGTPLDIDEMLPCVGQAALGIEVRRDNARIAAICRRLNHPETWQCVMAERSFLKTLGGGCHLAVAAYAQIQSAQIRIRGVSFLSGKARRGEIRGTVRGPVDLGRRLAVELSRKS
jgi:hydroxymethylbilane synthase